MLFWARGSGASIIVFGLGTPLDHPPETVLMWVIGSTILYIYRGQGGWSSGVTRPKTTTLYLILALYNIKQSLRKMWYIKLSYKELSTFPPNSNLLSIMTRGSVFKFTI